MGSLIHDTCVVAGATRQAPVRQRIGLSAVSSWSSGKTSLLRRRPFTLRHGFPQRGPTGLRQRSAVSQGTRYRCLLVASTPQARLETAIAVSASGALY